MYTYIHTYIYTHIHAIMVAIVCIACIKPLHEYLFIHIFIQQRTHQLPWCVYINSYICVHEYIDTHICMYKKISTQKYWFLFLHSSVYLSLMLSWSLALFPARVFSLAHSLTLLFSINQLSLPIPLSHFLYPSLTHWYKLIYPFRKSGSSSRSAGSEAFALLYWRRNGEYSKRRARGGGRYTQSMDWHWACARCD